MNFKERRELSRKEARNGRTDFPESALFPKRDDCPLAAYVVGWYTDKEKDEVTGNSWRSREKAAEVRDRKIDEGTFSGTVTQYFGGYL